ncbi:DUF3800 domain-containing protein [Kribbella sp. NBC_00382]|uniref:DUF3800 domain-containing protein n=1 Tax=Kribbella sp. NBC_00382 TaxID=2975967 RepID=UPI002E1B5AA9
MRRVLGMYFERPLVRAYIDETGDRGTSGKASRYFAMVAVVIGDEDDPSLRRAIEACRQRLSVPVGKPLHWTEHVKRFPRRQFVAGRLAAVEGVVVNFVLVEKAALSAGDPMRGDQVAFYNYVAGLILEGILLTANAWPGGRRDVVVTFGHVRGFPHEHTLAYFEKLRAGAVDAELWELLCSKPRFLGAGQLDGLQAADQYAGMLRAALEADEFGGFEHHHLLAIRHQIRRCEGESWGHGLRVIAVPGLMEAYPWWPGEGL